MRTCSSCLSRFSNVPFVSAARRWLGLSVWLVAFPLSAAEATPPAASPPPSPAPVATPGANFGALAPGQNDQVLAHFLKALRYGDSISSTMPTRSDAAIALGMLGDPRAVPDLVDCMRYSDNRSLRRDVVRALGWIGGPEAVSALEATLKDAEPTQRQLAAMVLKKLTGKDYEFDRTGLPDTSRVLEEIRARREGRTAAPKE